MKYCNRNCNECPIIAHPNSRMLTHIFNLLHDEFGSIAYEIIQKNCPNMTVCYDCGIDDFCHIKKCKL